MRQQAMSQLSFFGKVSIIRIKSIDNTCDTCYYIYVRR
nr:MAG TPA: hypothetical protein [Caudoviricetes sp.]